MKKENIALTCSKCEEYVDIFSVTQIEDRKVEIVFVCPSCGGTKISNNYLYKEQNVKTSQNK